MNKFLLKPFVMASLLFLVAAVPTAANSADESPDFVTQLTRQIFKRTEAQGAARRYVKGGQSFSRNRKFLELLTGENIEFTALPTKPEWEEKLIPIRIPIRKGLQGYRLFLINREDQTALSKVKTLEQLKEIPTGSGSQWSMTKALDAAGFNVVKARRREELIKMLGLRRFRTFGRGIDEIFSEHAESRDDFPDLALERDIALFIPNPIYYFVTPKRPDLAERIEHGLRGMIADGSFDKLFWKHYGDDIVRARLNERTIFSIPNPLLGPQTPLDDPSLWLDPANVFGDEGEGAALTR